MTGHIPTSEPPTDVVSVAPVSRYVAPVLSSSLSLSLLTHLK